VSDTHREIGAQTGDTRRTVERQIIRGRLLRRLLGGEDARDWPKKAMQVIRHSGAILRTGRP